MSATPKKIAEAIRAASGHLKNRNTTAIIVAGGSSTRMGGPVPKQFLVLGGMPVVVHTMRAYEESEYIDNIIVVAREEDVLSGCYEKFAEKFVKELFCE
jgi:2-C-methyl-D-erythritol 4-phosphate cytidylyltransferase